MELVGALESAVAGKMVRKSARIHLLFTHPLSLSLTRTHAHTHTQITPEFIHGICTKLFQNSLDTTQPIEIPRPSTVHNNYYPFYAI